MQGNQQCHAPVSTNIDFLFFFFKEINFIHYNFEKQKICQESQVSKQHILLCYFHRTLHATLSEQCQDGMARLNGYAEYKRRWRARYCILPYKYWEIPRSRQSRQMVTYTTRQYIPKHLHLGKRIILSINEEHHWINGCTPTWKQGKVQTNQTMQRSNARETRTSWVDGENWLQSFLKLRTFSSSSRKQEPIITDSSSSTVIFPLILKCSPFYCNI